MATERAAFNASILIIVIGTALLVYGMYLSAGQSANLPSFAGGFITLAGLVIMMRVTLSSFDNQERPEYGPE